MSYLNIVLRWWTDGPGNAPSRSSEDALLLGIDMVAYRSFLISPNTRKEVLPMSQIEVRRICRPVQIVSSQALVASHIAYALVLFAPIDLTVNLFVSSIPCKQMTLRSRLCSLCPGQTTRFPRPACLTITSSRISVVFPMMDAMLFQSIPFSTTSCSTLISWLWWRRRRRQGHKFFQSVNREQCLKSMFFDVRSIFPYTFYYICI